MDVNIYVKKTIQLGGVLCVYDLTFLDLYLVNDGAFFFFLLTMSLICDSVIWRETLRASSVSSTGLRALE